MELCGSYWLEIEYLVIIPLIYLPLLFGKLGLFKSIAVMGRNMLVLATLANLMFSDFMIDYNLFVLAELINFFILGLMFTLLCWV